MANVQIVTPPNIAKTPPFPCVQCLSETELMLALLFLFADLEDYALGTPGELARLDKDAACFSCWSDKQKMQAIVSGMALATDNFLTEDSLAESLKCLRCLAPGKVKGMLTYLIVKSFVAFTADEQET